MDEPVPSVFFPKDYLARPDLQRTATTVVVIDVNYEDITLSVDDSKNLYSHLLEILECSKNFQKLISNREKRSHLLNTYKNISILWNGFLQFNLVSTVVTGLYVMQLEALGRPAKEILDSSLLIADQMLLIAQEILACLPSVVEETLSPPPPQNLKLHVNIRFQKKGEVIDHSQDADTSNTATLTVIGSLGNVVGNYAPGREEDWLIGQLFTLDTNAVLIIPDNHDLCKLVFESVNIHKRVSRSQETGK
jgi:hypothetical protein